MCSTLVGKPAPHFSSRVVVNGNEIQDGFSLDQYKGKYVIFFFYPLDFTFVCPTELHAFQEAHEAFASRNVQVVGCSVDSWHTHMAWLATPKAQGGIQGITYPLVSDLTKEISEAYGVLKADLGAAYRGLFLIDRTGIVRHVVVNDLPLGRSVDEAIRIVDALQFYEQNGEVCPANWQKGKVGMKESREGVSAYLASH